MSLLDRLAARTSVPATLTGVIGGKKGACCSPREPCLSPRGRKRQKKEKEKSVTAVKTASSGGVVDKPEDFDSVEFALAEGLMKELRAEFEEGLAKGLEKGGALLAKTSAKGRVELLRIEQHSYHLAADAEVPA